MIKITKIVYNFITVFFVEKKLLLLLFKKTKFFSFFVLQDDFYHLPSAISANYCGGGRFFYLEETYPSI